MFLTVIDVNKTKIGNVKNVIQDLRGQMIMKRAIVGLIREKQNLGANVYVIQQRDLYKTALIVYAIHKQGLYKMGTIVYAIVQQGLKEMEINVFVMKMKDLYNEDDG